MKNNDVKMKVNVEDNNDDFIWKMVKNDFGKQSDTEMDSDDDIHFKSIPQMHHIHTDSIDEPAIIFHFFNVIPGQM